MNGRKPSKWENFKLEKPINLSMDLSDAASNLALLIEDPNYIGQLKKQSKFSSSSISIQGQKDGTIKVDDNGKTTFYSGSQASYNTNTGELFTDNNPTPVATLKHQDNSTKPQSFILNIESDSDSDNDSTHKSSPWKKHYQQVSANNIHSLQNATVVLSKNGTFEVVHESTHTHKPS